MNIILIYQLETFQNCPSHGQFGIDVDQNFVNTINILRNVFNFDLILISNVEYFCNRALHIPQND